MLALDDQSLARICIAASGVAPAARRAWLEDLAGRLEQEPAPAPSPGARTPCVARAPACRQGLLRLEIDEVEIGLAALEHDLVDPAVADDPVALTRRRQKGHRDVLFREVHRRLPEISDRLRARLVDAAIRRRAGTGSDYAAALQRALARAEGNDDDLEQLHRAARRLPASSLTVAGVAEAVSRCAGRAAAPNLKHVTRLIQVAGVQQPKEDLRARNLHARITTLGSEVRALRGRR